MATPLQRRSGRGADCAPRAGASPRVLQPLDERPAEPSVERGVDFAGAPKYWRQSRLIVDPTLPGVPTTTPLVLAQITLGRSEVLHLLRWGQRLVPRRHGRLPCPHGDPRPTLTGSGLTFTWFLTARATVAGNVAGGEPLVQESGSTRIVSPWEQPRAEHVLVSGPRVVELAVLPAGATRVDDHLAELGGFLEGWRYLEGQVPRDLLWLGLTSTR